MTRAVTEKFEEMVLEVETITPGTYAKVCGMMDVTINRKANTATTGVPDCDDESLALSMEVEVESIEVSVSASGVWAQTSNDMLLAWFYGGTKKNVRLRNTKASIGDIETEAGAAVLTSINQSRTKGQKVTAEIEMMFDGIPTRTDKA